MDFIHTSTLTSSQKEEILYLWNQEYPEQICYPGIAELESYLVRLLEQSHILMVDNQKIKGWYLDFNRDNEKWFAIIMDSTYQGKGLGTKMLNLAKEKEIELNGWVIDHDRYKKRNGETYASPLPFYLKNGFKVLREVRLELEQISAVKIQWTANSKNV